MPNLKRLDEIGHKTSVTNQGGRKYVRVNIFMMFNSMIRKWTQISQKLRQNKPFSRLFGKTALKPFSKHNSLKTLHCSGLKIKNYLGTNNRRHTFCFNITPLANNVKRTQNAVKPITPP